MASSTGPKIESSTFPFLKLPLEIRRMIYHHHIVQASPKDSPLSSAGLLFGNDSLADNGLLSNDDGLPDDYESLLENGSASEDDSLSEEDSPSEDGPLLEDEPRSDEDGPLPESGLQSERDTFPGKWTSYSMLLVNKQISNELFGQICGELDFSIEVAPFTGKYQARLNKSMLHNSIFHNQMFHESITKVTLHVFWEIPAIVNTFGILTNVCGLLKTNHSLRTVNITWRPSTLLLARAYLKFRAKRVTPSKSVALNILRPVAALCRQKPELSVHLPHDSSVSVQQLMEFWKI